MTLVELDKVSFFLRHRVHTYVGGYEGEEYDYDNLFGDLINYLEHPENWRQYMHDWPNKEYPPSSRLDTLDEVREELRQAESWARAPYEPTRSWAITRIPFFEHLLEAEK